VATAALCAPWAMPQFVLAAEVPDEGMTRGLAHDSDPYTDTVRLHVARMPISADAAGPGRTIVVKNSAVAAVLIIFIVAIVACFLFLIDCASRRHCGKNRERGIDRPRHPHTRQRHVSKYLLAERPHFGDKASRKGESWNC
jgi:hypothetical protein